jgi:hypothetical protein
MQQLAGHTRTTINLNIDCLQQSDSSTAKSDANADEWLRWVLSVALPWALTYTMSGAAATVEWSEQLLYCTHPDTIHKVGLFWFPDMAVIYIRSAGDCRCCRR